MKSKIIAAIMVVFAVVLYTMAVVDFMLSKPLDAVCNVLFACTDIAVAYMLIRMENQRKALVAFLKLHFDFIEQLKKGVDIEVVKTETTDTETESETTDDEEVKKLREDIDIRDADIARLMEERESLKHDLDKANAFIRDLRPEIGTAAEPWVPQPEIIRSVYAAAGVMEQMNEHTDAKNLNTLWEQLKQLHKAGEKIE